MEDEELLEETEETPDEEIPEEEDPEEEIPDDPESDEGIPEAELEGQDAHEEGIPDEQALIEEIRKDGAGEDGDGQKADDEILVENRCTVDKNLYFEAVKAMSNRKKDLTIAVIAAILVPVGLMMDNRIVAVISLVIAVVALSYRTLVGYRDYGRLKKVHPDGCWTKHVCVYSDHVETSTEGAENITVVPLEKLKKIRSTDHLCILDFGKYAPATLMDKDGFQVGSPEDLRYLMKDLDRKEADRRANS